MSSHTPGPWRMKFKKNSDWTIWAADGYNVLGIPHDDEHGRTSEDEANACLIAAAPDMLEALKQYFDTKYAPTERAYERLMDKFEKSAEAAIAKADDDFYMSKTKERA